MRYFIGLDGGGSGCRAQAELADGRRSAIISGGPANVATDLDAALREIQGVIDKAVQAAQALSPQAPLPAPRVVLGLAGANETDAELHLRKALPFNDLIVTGDIDIALRGALGEADGIVMAVGTGSVLACQRAGDLRRLGGYGLALGDEGSGAWLGLEALRACLCARDGIGPDGPLVQEIWGRFGSVAEMITFVATARPADYATFAPIVMTHDRAHCPVAGAILDRGCAYLLRAIRQLQGGDCGLPVVAAGGLGPVLLDWIEAQGAAQLRRAIPLGTALDGALWLARCGAGARRVSA